MRASPSRGSSSGGSFLRIQFRNEAGVKIDDGWSYADGITRASATRIEDAELPGITDRR
jgi:hypothetical protein